MRTVLRRLSSADGSRGYGSVICRSCGAATSDPFRGSVGNQPYIQWRVRMGICLTPLPILWKLGNAKSCGNESCLAATSVLVSDWATKPPSAPVSCRAMCRSRSSTDVGSEPSPRGCSATHHRHREFLRLRVRRSSAVPSQAGIRASPSRVLNPSIPVESTAGPRRGCPWPC